jgi:hypothetical protein
MAIDRIGKGGAPASVPELGGSSASRPAGQAFVEAGGGPLAASPASPASPAAVAAPSSALERLRAGAIDVDGYLNLKTEEATAHLSSLPPVQLEAIRSALRDRLASDPSLVDLVRTATSGAAPRDDRDD